MDMVEDVVALGDRELALLRPRDPDAMLVEEAFEREELLPYWGELWPSGVTLARALSGRALRGARTLELGCGMGTASIAAALAGGRVLATDWSQAAVELTERNAERNGAWLRTRRCAFEDAPGDHDWDLVLAADVLYEERNVALLLSVLPRLVGARGEVMLADPGRPSMPEFLERARADWDVRTVPSKEPGGAAVHRMRLA